MMKAAWRGILVGVCLTLLGGAQPGAAVTLGEARSSAIGWLEKNQNSDGSWGSGSTRALVTAEALLALSAAERADGAPARRAKAWLLNQDYSGLDYRARATRALSEAGVDVAEQAQALLDRTTSGEGWGPTSAQGVTSYDSALVLGAVRAAGVSVPDESAKLALILGLRRSDSGWSGDGVPVDAESASDRTITAEIVRALADVTDATTLSASHRYISTQVSAGGQAVDSSTPTLELASRLAALHALELDDAGLETELLASYRFPSPVWSTDPFVNAIGLLAVTTKPGASFPPACSGDADCDGVADGDDAFPHDAGESQDTDGDGVGDNADTDRDGDGVLNGDDAFAGDPTEWADSDGDTVGDNQEIDADNDGKLDEQELEQGLDPTLADTDGDTVADGSDPCPLVAGGAELDQDGDGVCQPFDQCDTQADPFDTLDLDGDGTCDLADDDDDGDGFDDLDELAWGSDPRDDTSVPDVLAGSEDFDGDGLLDWEELAQYGTSPYRMDTDNDGATDYYETQVGTNPLLASSQPEPVIAVLGGISPAPEPASGDAGAGIWTTATGAQSTPTGEAPGEGGGLVNLPGFQPQTLLARDGDGDGLIGFEESAQSTSLTKVDTDGDGFADGPDGFVAVADYPGGWNLNDDAFVDGEADTGTDPADASDHPGKAGDVAPLGAPDGQVNIADGVVELRIVADPSLVDSLGGDRTTLTQQAADVDGNEAVDAGDALRLLKQVSEE